MIHKTILYFVTKDSKNLPLYYNDEVVQFLQLIKFSAKGGIVQLQKCLIVRDKPFKTVKFKYFTSLFR